MYEKLPDHSMSPNVIRPAGAPASALRRQPEEDDAPAGAHEPRRELDGRGRAGGLDHEVEPSADDATRLRDGVLLADVHRRICAESLGEAELLGPDPVRDERARCVQARERDGKRPERPDPDDADRLAGLWRPRSSPRSTHEPGSTSTAAPKETASGNGGRRGAGRRRIRRSHRHG